MDERQSMERARCPAGVLRGRRVRTPASLHGWRTAYGCGRSGDELYDDELGTARAGARRRVRGVAAGAGVLRGLAPVTVFDDAGAAYGESKESERDGEFGEGELMGTTVQFIEEKRED
jgi:hypothetical protein